MKFVFEICKTIIINHGSERERESRKRKLFGSKSRHERDGRRRWNEKIPTIFSMYVFSLMEFLTLKNQQNVSHNSDTETFIPIKAFDRFTCWNESEKQRKFSHVETLKTRFFRIIWRSQCFICSASALLGWRFFMLFRVSCQSLCLHRSISTVL